MGTNSSLCFCGLSVGINKLRKREKHKLEEEKGAKIGKSVTKQIGQPHLLEHTYRNPNLDVANLTPSKLLFQGYVKYLGR